MTMRNFRRQRSEGIALVIVLFLIVLLTVLVVSFFTAVRSESVAASNYSERTKVKMLADSVENLAVGQIQKATSGLDDGRVVAWASQPAMIRTWDQKGDAAKAYKLYSSDRMILDGGFASEADIAGDVAGDWKSRPEEFTDLNAPVLAEDPNGLITRDGARYTAKFPIISGNHLVSMASAGASKKTYEANVEGFWIQGQPDVADAAIRPDNNPVPMPVRWIYVLADGKLAAISGGAIPGAGAENPVVARVAFWTDDETTKININTASEGAFWDRPYNSGWTERVLGNNIPAQNEFATFPGHPATTSLSAVLGSLFPVPDWISSPADYEALLPYYNLTPRVSAGGSKGGSVRAKGAADIVQYDADRLYSSVDEFIFKAQGGAGNREPNNPAITNAFLEQARFFLTAHSRAPEVNLFNLPRVGLWPLDPNVQNSKDRLISYCSTINGKPFYFSRTVVPGKSPSAQAFLETSQSATKDWDKYPRNQVLYGYLQALTSADLPGLGGNLSTKYPGNLRDQILTEMVDLVRSGVNTTSSELTPVYNFTPPRGVAGQGQVVPLTLSRSGSGGNDTRGFGRFMTVSEGALVLYHSGARDDKVPAAKRVPLTNEVKAVFVMEPFCPSPGLPSWSPNVRIRVKNLDKFQVDGVPLNLPADATMTCDAFESEPFQSSSPGTYPSGSTAFPATRLLFYHMQGKRRVPKTVSGQDGTPPASIYPFASKAPVALNYPVDDGIDHYLTLTGAPVEIEIYGPNPGDTTPVQTLKLDFANTAYSLPGRKPREPVRIPAPEPVPEFKNVASVFGSWDFSKRIPAATGSSADIKTTLVAYEGTMVDIQPKGADRKDGNNEFNRRGDVVRSLEASGGKPLFGDLRALSLISDDDAPDNTPLFARHLFYDAFDLPGSTPLTVEDKTFDPSGRARTGAPASRTVAEYNYRFATGLRSDENVYQGQFATYMNLFRAPSAYTQSGDRKGSFLTAGSLLPLPANTYIQRDAIPSVPFGLNGAFIDGDPSKPGDWDSGLGVCSDGPYVNLPDQGNSAIEVKSGLQGGIQGSEIYGGYFGRGEFGTTAGVDTAAATFSPNRQIASAVAFGSLSTGVDPKNPGTMNAWRTLLFCANPAAGSLHPGFGISRNGPNPYPPYSTPPDHAFLDLFTMPIVEGYPISEPMSTAGKVNMNYQIAPFTYIHRSTAIRAVLKKVCLSAVPTSELTNSNDDNAIKSANTDAKKSGWTTQVRHGIALDEQTGTLRQFEQRFKKGDLFRSASEICDVLLVPRHLRGIRQTYRSSDKVALTAASDEIDFRSNAVTAWWRLNALTGDNLRETPYGHIYPRLTTKSNSYTIHVRVQTLRKTPNTPSGTFVEPSRRGATDKIAGEYRGSFEIERYLDPNALEQAGLDLATIDPQAPQDTLGKFYKFRTITSKEFRP